MMNHHLPAGPHMNPPSINTHQHQHQHQHPLSNPHQHQHQNQHQPSRRQQDYHNQFHPQQMPISPGPMHNPYAAHYNHAAYYAHPAAHMPYAVLPRWQQPQQQQQQQQQQQAPQQPYIPAYAMGPAPHYPPRSPMSPMIVSSQMSSQPPPITPLTRQPPPPYLPQRPESPAPGPHTPLTPSSTAPQSFVFTPSSTAQQSSVPPPRPESVQSANTPAPLSRRSSSVVPSHPSSPPLTHRMPFYPPLPWLSRTDVPFPAKARRRRRKRQELLQPNDSVALPSRQAGQTEPENEELDQSDAPAAIVDTVSKEAETPVPSQSSLDDSTNNFITESKSTSQDAPDSAASTSTPPHTEGKRTTRTAMPIIPAVPNIPSRHKGSLSEAPATPPQSTAPAAPSDDSVTSPTQDAKEVDAASITSPTPKPAAPKSWADLVRAKNAGAVATAAVVNGGAATNGAGTTRASSVAEAIKQFKVGDHEKVAFLEPRGLVNTGNMCYMNSILQILTFCPPFYNFLEQLSRKTVNSFKSPTPLVDAMLLFVKEFNTIDSAESVDKLRMRLKQDDLEQYGTPIIPGYVYDVIKELPRFASMRRGHQQDAEEFLGFLLSGMHEEFVAVIRSQSDGASANQPISPTADKSNSGNGWLEVGPKQKSAVTRESGDIHDSPTPITKIFGGQLRSELRAAGQKNSVNIEDYLPLQLDIGGPQINNITDALRAITKSEIITGVQNSRDGKATKQLFIESLPPVLILHLKRFQYDNTGGTQKIWKKVGYPLQLELPKEVFAPAKRAALGITGEPKYRLISVVYHHGKSAAGGHYTVDILRQDEREWVRVDDTVIRRIRAEDVAEGGSEEDPKTLARALEQHASDQPGAKRNLFEGLDGNGDDDTESVRSWNEVNGAGAAKKWGSAAAAVGQQDKKEKSSGRSTPASKAGGSVRDNKVAYILLYERING